MKIEKGKTYTCKKNLRSKGKIVFVENKEYAAQKDDALIGEDNISYAFPEHLKLSDYFRLKAL